MPQSLPTPKWEKAPSDVRDAWHNLNNTRQRLQVLHEQAQDLVDEMAKLLADLPGDESSH